MHPEDRDSCSERAEQAFCAKADLAKEYRIMLPDGTGKHLHEIGHPVLHETGPVVENVGTDVDVTDRKRAEEELRESEKRYRYIFQTAGVSIWEEDFSQVKAAIDALRAQGVQDFRQSLAT